MNFKSRRRTLLPLGARSTARGPPCPMLCYLLPSPLSLPDRTISRFPVNLERPRRRRSHDKNTALGARPYHQHQNKQYDLVSENRSGSQIHRPSPRLFGSSSQTTTAAAVVAVSARWRSPRCTSTPISDRSPSGGQSAIFLRAACIHCQMENAPAVGKAGPNFGSRSFWLAAALRLRVCRRKRERACRYNSRTAVT